MSLKKVVMDLINGCEWNLINYSDGWQQIVFNGLEYWMADYEETLTGNYHVTFTLNPN